MTRRAIDPNNVLSLVPLTVADAKARFADPIVFSFHSCIVNAHEALKIVQSGALRALRALL